MGKYRSQEKFEGKEKEKCRYRRIGVSYRCMYSNKMMLLVVHR